MPGSEEFLKKFVVDRGLAPRERIADLAAKAAGPENASLATLLVKEGVVVEDELKTLLEAFAKDLEKEGNLPASESAAFGSRVAKKGLASPSSIWNAIRSQERNRGEGTEVSLDFFLVEDGTVDSGKISEVLGEIGHPQAARLAGVGCRVPGALSQELHLPCAGWSLNIVETNSREYFE